MSSESCRSKVLVLAKGWPPTPGGVERYSKELSKAYKSKGHDVVVLAADGVDPDLPFGVIRLPSKGGQFRVALECFVRLISMLWKRKETENLAFIHATTWRIAVPAILLRMQKRWPLVVTVHGREAFSLPFILKPIRNWVLASCSLRVAVSPYTAGRIEREIGLNSIVALNGTSAPEALQTATSEALGVGVRLLTVCRLEKRKNIGQVVRALQLLNTEGVTLTIVGSGPESDRLADIVQECGLGDQVTISGRLSDHEMWRLYHSSDIFVHPHIEIDQEKDFEGFGLTIADAMSVGMPAIVGAASGVGTFLTEEEGVVTVDGKNVEQLRTKLELLINDAPLRARLGASGRRYASGNLTWGRHAGAITEALNIA